VAADAGDTHQGHVVVGVQRGDLADRQATVLGQQRGVDEGHGLVADRGEDPPQHAEVEHAGVRVGQRPEHLDGDVSRGALLAEGGEQAA
ncbi:hypothetical protein DF186_17255, partial [Enterococcus hirae]